ncbi:MAG: hypothetical protein LC624_11845, partial [Halobacteriales archaeon]|nr:hypothetical protein [Halobacteriales archaeon]
MPRALPALLALVLLAGCTAKPAADEAAPVKPASDGAIAGTPPTGTAPPANATSANASAPVAVATPLAYHGTTGAGVCAFEVVVGQCVTPVAGQDDLKEVAVKGKLVHLNGTATWT